MKKYLMAVCAWLYSMLIKMDELIFFFFVADFFTHWPGQTLLWLENYFGFYLSDGQQAKLSFAIKLIKFLLFVLLYSSAMVGRTRQTYNWIAQKIKNLTSKF